MPGAWAPLGWCHKQNAAVLALRDGQLARRRALAPPSRSAEYPRVWAVRDRSQVLPGWTWKRTDLLCSGIRLDLHKGRIPGDNPHPCHRIQHPSITQLSEKLRPLPVPLALPALLCPRSTDSLSFLQFGYLKIPLPWTEEAQIKDAPWKLRGGVVPRSMRSTTFSFFPLTLK